MFSPLNPKPISWKFREILLIAPDKITSIFKFLKNYNFYLYTKMMNKRHLNIKLIFLYKIIYTLKGSLMKLVILAGGYGTRLSEETKLSLNH